MKLIDWIKRKLRGEYILIHVVGNYARYMNGDCVLTRGKHSYTTRIWCRSKDLKIIDSKDK